MLVFKDMHRYTHLYIKTRKIYSQLTINVLSGSKPGMGEAQFNFLLYNF